MYRERLGHKTAVLILSLVICTGVFINVVDDVFFDPYEEGDSLFEFDHRILSLANSLRSPYLTQAMTDITALGSVSVMSILFIVVLIIMRSFKDYKGFAYQGIILVGTLIIPWVLKILFMRERPNLIERLVHVSDTSFPSGHSFTATSIYIAIAYYGGRFAKTRSQSFLFYLLGALLILLVCLSRIYLGVHYPTDVIAGFSAGAIWALSVTLGFEIYSPETKMEDKKWQMKESKILTR